MAYGVGEPSNEKTFEFCLTISVKGKQFKDVEFNFPQGAEK
jgi:hypothetical protein